MTKLRLNVHLQHFPVLKAFCLATMVAGGLTGCSNPGTIVVTPTLSSLKGSYVFSVEGTDPNDGDYAIVGSFVADGQGHITSGVADYNLGSGIDANVKLTGTYAVSPGNTTIILTDGGFVQDTFSTTFPGNSPTPISAYDGNGTGMLYPQVTAGFTPAGSYSFTMSGEEQGNLTGSGSFVAGAGGAFSSGSLTLNNGSAPISYATTTGFLYNPQSGGRGQASIEGNNLAYYVISPTQVAMVGLDDRALLQAMAQKQ
jgi:hypothetical protein